MKALSYIATTIAVAAAFVAMAAGAKAAEITYVVTPTCTPVSGKSNMEYCYEVDAKGNYSGYYRAWVDGGYLKLPINTGK